MKLEEFKISIMGEIEKEKSIKYRYPVDVEPVVNIGLTMAFGIVLDTNNTLVNTEEEFATEVIRKIEYKKKVLAEDENTDPTNRLYILLGMETACDIVREMLDKANGD